MQKPDYIILGAGASGLQLAYRMALDAFFDGKQILIVDKDIQKGNDRTWCFWEDGTDEWDDILHHTWTSVYFGSEWFSKTINITPYSYKMIKSKAYYEKLWSVIKAKSNIKFIQAEVEKLYEENGKAIVKTSKGAFSSAKLFNSLPLDNSFKHQSKYPVLMQHFVGWFIKTKTPQFDDSFATFMDFNVPQNQNTRFMYVLPTSPTEALFEYTLFSKELLDKAAYEKAIVDYLNSKGIKDYEIVEKEAGAIPMTSYQFSKENTEHILHIGTAGGWTKASTGYTFMNTTKRTIKLVTFLKQNSDLRKFQKRNKFWYYDLLMLDVLATDNGFGAKLFSSMFKNIKVGTIFKFLDEESSLYQDLRIITSVPPMRFVKALIKRLF